MLNRWKCPLPQVPLFASHQRDFGLLRLGESLEDPMPARLAPEPVLETGASHSGAPAGQSARKCHEVSVPALPEDTYPALASRRAISDTPDALSAALPRNSPSRFGR